MKRFIAGAVCPDCRALDRLVLEARAGANGDEEWQRCVACGYEAVRPGANSSHMAVPRGKPERPTQPSAKIETQTVKIMDLQPKLDAQDEPK